MYFERLALGNSPVPEMTLGGHWSLFDRSIELCHAVTLLRLRQKFSRSMEKLERCIVPLCSKVCHVYV